MLREPNLTDGIGVRIAHNIPCTSTKDALIDRVLTSVTSVKKRKTTKTVQHKDLTFYLLNFPFQKAVYILKCKSVIAEPKELIRIVKT
jgi:hypothetical protein